MPGAEALRVSIASKRFGARQVLTDLRFTAAPGEVLALLAPSGTGKTTALRIVLGLDRAFEGQVVRPAGPMGAVFQDPRLLPWLDIAANLRLVAPGLTTAEIDGLLALVSLEGAGRYPRELSLGMARRVHPVLLVLDEPFASLDPSLALTLSRAVIARARADRATVLLASHDLDQALAIADRILILGGPDLAASGTDAATLRAQFPFLSGEPR
jgi:ABC-type nitrate/sulfonate/bicarbonate transport system ATPase subunit